MHTIEMLNDSLDSVQVVFLLPFGSDFLQERIRRVFMAPLVTIARSKGTAAWRQCDASERLVELARASDVETNSSLESLLERYRCNRVEKPIEGVFSDWVALERTRRGFPAYASSFGKVLSAIERGQTMPIPVWTAWWVLRSPRGLSAKSSEGSYEQVPCSAFPSRSAVFDAYDFLRLARHGKDRGGAIVRRNSSYRRRLARRTPDGHFRLGCYSWF